jgi:putative ABC transport system permease protein
MKYLPLLWRNLWRRKVRTIFTFLSIVVAFLLFGILMAIRNSFEAGIDLAGQNRLLTIH